MNLNDDSSDDEYFTASSGKYEQPDIYDVNDTSDNVSDNDQSVADDPVSDMCSEYRDEEYLTAEKLEIKEDEHRMEMEKCLTSQELKEREERALTLKLHGNDMFKAERYAYANMYYTAALNIMPSSPEYHAQRAVFHSNRAAVFTKTQHTSHAIQDCTSALRYDPQYQKPLLRRAQLLDATEKFEESLKDYQVYFEKNQSDRDVYYKIQYLKTAIEEKNEKMKEEMMGKLKDLGNMCLKPFGLSTDNFQMKKDPTTGSYSVNFQQ